MLHMLVGGHAPNIRAPHHINVPHRVSYPYSEKPKFSLLTVRVENSVGNSDVIRSSDVWYVTAFVGWIYIGDLLHRSMLHTCSRHAAGNELLESAHDLLLGLTGTQPR